MPVLNLANRYSSRLNRVLNYTHANAHRDLSLERLAQMACLSRFHFARVFHDQVGESPLQFVKRTRLEKIASLLKSGFDRPVADIAAHYGFTSPQTFSREFGLRFDTSPARYRRAHLENQEERRGIRASRALFDQFDRIGIDLDAAAFAKRIEIIDMAPLRVAYVRNLGRYGGCNGIGRAMNEIEEWARDHGYWAGSTRITGVSWDYSSITPKSLCRYDVCVPIAADLRTTNGISTQWLPGGRYAVTEVPYDHPSELPAIWKWFALALESSPRFKRYGMDRSIGPWYETYLGGRDDPVIRMHIRLSARHGLCAFNIS